MLGYLALTFVCLYAMREIYFIRQEQAEKEDAALLKDYWRSCVEETEETELRGAKELERMVGL